MWYFYDEKKYKNTSLYKKSKIIVNYLKSIEGVNTLEYRNYLNRFRENFKGNEIIGFISFVERMNPNQREKLREVIYTNLDFDRACRKENFLYRYEGEKSIADTFSQEFSKITKDFCQKLWILITPDEKSEYLKMILESISPRRICPFCGIEELKSGRAGKRSPLDHFIPRSKYPFLDFYQRNLVLMCESCNSIKGSKIITEKNGWMGPYIHDMKYEFNLELKDFNILDKEYKFDINVKNATKKDLWYIETWDKIFALEKRIEGTYFEEIETLENNLIEDRETQEMNKRRLKKNIETKIKRSLEKGEVVKASYYQKKSKDLQK